MLVSLTTSIIPTSSHRVRNAPYSENNTLTPYFRYPGPLPTPPNCVKTHLRQRVLCYLQGFVRWRLYRLVSFLLSSPPRLRPLILLVPRDEVGAWVLGVSGSLYRKTKTWDEAKVLYNLRLSTGAIRILS